MPKKKTRPPGRLKAKLAREKPWAKLGITRAKYEADRMWKGMGLKREGFEALLEKLPQDVVDLLWEKAEAEHHEEEEAARIERLMGLLGFKPGDVVGTE